MDVLGNPSEILNCNYCNFRKAIIVNVAVSKRIGYARESRVAKSFSGKTLSYMKTFLKIVILLILN